MAATAQISCHAGHFVFTFLLALCVLSNGGIALSTTIQATRTSAYLSSGYATSVVASDVSSSDFQSVELSPTPNISDDETSTVTSSTLDSSSGSVLTTPSAIVETSVILVTSFSFNYTATTPTVGTPTTDTFINRTDVTSYLFSTSSNDLTSTAGISSSIGTASAQTSTPMDQLNSSIISTDLGSDLSSAISPSTTYLAIESSLYTETPTVTDLVLSSSRSFGDITSAPFMVTSTSLASEMTESSLQPSTVMSNISSVVNEITATLTSTTTDGTLTSTYTPSSLSPSSSPEFTSSSEGLFITATTHANTPVYTSTQHATTTTSAFLKTSSEISQTEHVTSSSYSSYSASSSSVVIAPTSTSDAGLMSSTMSVTPDPNILAELDNLRSKVQELEATNSGLQTATIVLAIVIVLIILAVIGLVYLRRRRMAKRKKNRFAGIDADLTTPVIQRPKLAFGQSGHADIFGGRISTATLDGSEEMSTLGTFSTLPKSTAVCNNNMDTPS
ncbi:mucin-5AC-like [Mizuhopecten yessoensis]|uniref:Uncharacterized protein n=1 Tax=Mizuhopecten yessoensis TaxID=6573 RepID=A0A210QSF4_MIZYE|nr:mucin-5AC-like [Mizuhopecten yessoensis]XP_021350979.1 mucin-5AC-like [Mizuhopecten yessoensis]XP_021350981.1 mucin-5AC-like [Mizuhopecten yessoensis]OWF51654.1 hypothetical protein KP79_PYT11717 [Mizuhopecten yessoensis]